MTQLEKTVMVRRAGLFGQPVPVLFWTCRPSLSSPAIRAAIPMPVPGTWLPRRPKQTAQQPRVPWRSSVERNGPGHSRCRPRAQHLGASSRRSRLSPPWSSVSSDRRRSYIFGVGETLTTSGQIPTRFLCRPPCRLNADGPEQSRRRQQVSISRVSTRRMGVLLFQRINGGPTTHWPRQTAAPSPVRRRANETTRRDNGND